MSPDLVGCLVAGIFALLDYRYRRVSNLVVVLLGGVAFFLAPVSLEMLGALFTFGVLHLGGYAGGDVKAAMATALYFPFLVTSGILGVALLGTLALWHTARVGGRPWLVLFAASVVAVVGIARVARLWYE